MRDHTEIQTLETIFLPELLSPASFPSIKGRLLLVQGSWFFMWSLWYKTGSYVQEVQVRKLKNILIFLCLKPHVTKSTRHRDISTNSSINNLQSEYKKHDWLYIIRTKCCNLHITSKHMAFHYNNINWFYSHTSRMVPSFLEFKLYIQARGIKNWILTRTRYGEDNRVNS